jgi:hypothetical protein
MRLVGAGLFVFGSMLLLVVVLGSQNVFDHAPVWVVGPGIAAFMVGMTGLSLWVFNRKGSDPFGRKTVEERLRELEEEGQLESVAFRATRAFGVEESEDEGLHYFLELADGRVLFLSGQYLYDYEPISGDPEMNQARSFPCTEFTIRRHKKDRYVLDMLRGGAVLEPEIMAPPFGKKAWQENRIPEDGQVIAGASYDELKREHASPAGGGRRA